VAAFAMKAQIRRYLQPEFEDHAINRVAGRKIHGFEDGEPRRQADHEGWEDDMEGDGKGELNLKVATEQPRTIKFAVRLETQISVQQLLGAKNREGKLCCVTPRRCVPAAP
jgi:hypothetical protein